MRLSVVLPIFNEAENLEPLYARLTVALDRIACDYELILVDDGSTDESLNILERLSAEDSRVKFLSLSRNFGHEIASTAGLDVADGDAVVLMDADLQDPPELIERMLEPWIQGFDVVYATRTRREGESFLKRATSYLFYRGMRKLSSLDLPLDTGDFRLMDRRVVQAFRQFSENRRFVRGLVTWMGFRQTSVEYDRPARHAGAGKYSPSHLIKLGLDALLSFSLVPLRLIWLLGLLCIAISLVGAGTGFVREWLLDIAPAAGNSTNFFLTLFSGTQLVAIGILGEYVGRVHHEVLNRPLYLVDRQRGFASKATRVRSPQNDRSRVPVAPQDESNSSRQKAA